jgi:hypothetical protein
MTENEVTAPSRRKIPHVGWFFAAAVVLGTATIALTVVFPFVRRVELIREIESRGGQVLLTNRGPKWLRRLTPRIGILDVVTDVRLERMAFDRTIIPRLAIFSQMRDLHLSYSAVTDDDMPAISRLTSIHYLDLSHCRVSGRGFGALAQLPNLEQVGVTYAPVRDVALEHLDRIPTLKWVGIYGCRHLSPEGIVDFATRNPAVQVAGVRDVMRIWIKEKMLTDEQKAKLTALPNAPDP